MEKIKPKTTVIITYREVDNFPSGEYDTIDGGKLIVRASECEDYSAEKAPGLLSRLMHGLPSEEIDGADKVFMYCGLHAMNESLERSSRLCRAVDLTLVACDCEEEKKARFARHHDIDLIYCGCGGRRALEKIARETIAGLR